MALSEVTICNIALSRVGDKQIISLTEDSKQARSCKLLYEPERDTLLESYKWNFAGKRRTIAQLSEAPDFEYAYQYQLPTDYLNVRELYNTTSPYEIEGDKLLIDDDAVYMKYTARITDPNLFKPSFVNCLALKIAAELAVKLADSKTMKNLILEEFFIMIKKAYRLNAIEGDPPDKREDTSWQKAGR